MDRRGQLADLSIINRCRTCRKRKTRCDGKRPLCSTCTDNGHDCMGYADAGAGEGAMTPKREKRERDSNGMGRHNMNEDDDNDDEERERERERHNENARTSDERSRRDMQRTFSVDDEGAQRRMTAQKTESNSYFPPSAAAPKERDAGTRQGEKAPRPNFQNYRESAVFSDEGSGTSPLGML